MIEHLYDYLSERPEGARSEELLGLIFRDSGADEAFGREFLAALLADDPRFEGEPQAGCWRLADEHLLDEPLCRAAFVVVDLESTGQRPDESGITEIGAVRLHGTEEIARFESLVNPGKPIPPYVASLTGITDAMVAEAPTIGEVLPRFAEFAAGAVVVAHNAAFDVAVLDRASRSVLGRPLGLPSLCTFKLARRLLPEVQRASLDGLAAHFGLAKASRHRALADAELTAAVLVRLTRMFEQDGTRTVNELLDAQDDPASPRRLDIRIPRAGLEALPERPGVFWLRDESGQTLFVGQADNLRGHVVSYFVGRTHLSDRQFEMVAQAVDVGFSVADSRLERAVIETREIRSRKPVFNRPDKHLPRGSFVKIQRRGRFPRALVASRISGDGALYLGPIKSRGFANDAVTLVAKVFGLRTCAGALHPSAAVEPCWLGPAGWCSSPCNAVTAAEKYRGQLEDAERVLARDPSALRALIVREPVVGSGDTRASRDIAVLGRLQKLHRRRHWLVNAHNYVAAFPATEGGLWIAVVTAGFCRRIRHVHSTSEVSDALAWGVDLEPNRRIGHVEADLSTILAHWVRASIVPSELLLVDLDGRDLQSSLAAGGEEIAVLVEAG